MAEASAVLPTPASPSRNKRTPQPERQEERHRQAAIGDVAVRGEPLLQVGKRALENGRILAPGVTSACDR